MAPSPEALERKRIKRAANRERENAVRRLWCKKNPDKVKALRDRFNAKNPSRRNEISRNWYDRNIEAQRARAIAYRNSNIEKARVNSIRYNSENLDRLAAIARNRRARQRNNGGTHTAEDVADIVRLQKGKCAYCRCKLDRTRHVDHIIPLALGGSNGRKNLQVLCRPCNKTKSAKDPIKFSQSLGMLL